MCGVYVCDVYVCGVCMCVVCMCVVYVWCVCVCGNVIDEIITHFMIGREKVGMKN